MPCVSTVALKCMHACLEATFAAEQGPCMVNVADIDGGITRVINPIFDASTKQALPLRVRPGRELSRLKVRSRAAR